MSPMAKIPVLSLLKSISECYNLLLKLFAPITFPLKPSKCNKTKQDQVVFSSKDSHHL